jgi:hypothetical protein
MKKITKDTILKQGNKYYQPVEVDDVIYWCSNDKINIDDAYLGWEENYHTAPNKRWVLYNSVSGLNGENQLKVMAQSKPILDIEEIPVIDLMANNTRLIIEGNDPFELHLYTQKDIWKAINLARLPEEYCEQDESYSKHTLQGILDQIDSISVIEVDEDFNIVSYE